MGIRQVFVDNGLHKMKIDIDDLRKLISYDPETGAITRISSPQPYVVGRTFSSPSTDGYISIKVLGKSIRAHRLAWMIYYGEEPGGEIDHFDGDKSNNRISNLRDVSHKENIHNQSRPQGSNPYLGVHMTNGRWRATIKVDGKIKYIGSFDTAQEARDAYVEKKRELHYPSRLTA
jgi:hypothetical protein